MTTSLPITSKSLPAAAVTAGANSEATLTLTQAAGPVFVVQGLVAGVQASFVLPAGAIPASAAAGGVFTVLVQNIRVNASTGGAPQVTESGVINYAVGGSSANAAVSSLNVGYILTSLGATSMTAGIGGVATSTSTTYTACGGNSPSSVALTPTLAGGGGAVTVSFAPQIKELVGSAFKGAGAAPSGEGGTFVGAGAGAAIGVATTADLITVTYANIPASATVWVPGSMAICTAACGTAGQATTTLTTSGTPPTTGPFSGAFVPPAVAGETLTDTPFVAFTPSSGTVVVTYTVSVLNGGATGTQTWTVATVVTFAANSAGAQAAMTAQVAYGPTGSVTGPATAIPTFAASTLPAASGSIIVICQTSVLFPFVTNQLGFDTGLVLANTSTDVLGFGGKSLAAPNSGTCLLSFFGAGAPTPSSGVADPLGVNTTGGTHAFLLSSVAPGFQGYVIATCPMLYIHGYAFIEFNLTQSSGVVEGYLAPNLAGRPTAGAPEATTF